MLTENLALITEENARQYWASFPKRWEAMVAHIASAPSGIWLMGHANYLLKTSSLWAVDLNVCPTQAKQHLLPRLRQDLAALQVVMVTHYDVDHYDAQLLEALGENRLTVLVPHFIFPEDAQRLMRAGIVLRIVRPGDRIHLGELDIQVLPGFHVDQAGVGVDAVGYRVRSQEQSFLFPSDVRNYPMCHHQPGADWLFAHLWLGRVCAHLPPCEPGCSLFCDYLQRMNARHVLLTHLYDFGRIIPERWGTEHVALVQECLEGRGVSLDLAAPALGCRIPIDQEGL